jgi:hypothetical protein
VVLVLKKVMHPQSEIVQIELAEVFTGDCERIKVVFLEVSSESFSALLVFSPNESGSEEKHGGNDRGDDVNSDFALKGLNHG